MTGPADPERAAFDQPAEILESISDAFYAVDAEWRFTYINRRAEELWQVRRDELVGTRLWDAFPATRGGHAYRELHRAMAERRAVEFEVVSRVDDQWLGVNAYPRRAGGLAVYMHNISARRQAERKVRESEERPRLAVDATGMGTWDIDLRSGVFEWSARYRAMLDIPESTMPSQAGFDAAVHPLDLPAVHARQAWSMDPASGGRYHTEFRTGTGRWIRSVGQVHFDEAGAAIRVVGTSLDITDLKRGEAARAQARADLEQRVAQRTAELAAANQALLTQIEERERVEAHLRQSQRIEAVGQLTAGVAHDFNNLLTGIVGNLDLLQRHRPDERSQRLINAALGAAERGARLTGQLLAFARKQRLAPEAVDLNQVVARVRSLLESTLGGTIRVEARLAPDPWGALVDPTQIELVILNLAINARDAMPDGGVVTLATANVSWNAPRQPGAPPAGDYVCLAVDDTGTGMTEAVRARAFEPFFTTKAVGRGSGLGLSQVYGLARQSGGGVVIESAVGRGTSVRVYLPRAAAPPAPRLGQAAPATTPVPIGHAAVLLVDDDEAVRTVTRSMLEDLGYRVREAEGGDGALTVLAAGEPADVLLVDLAMPDMNGAEVARRARELRPMLPLLFMTGYTDPDVIAKGVSEDRVISKPFRIAELAAKLEAVLGASGAPVD